MLILLFTTLSLETSSTAIFHSVCGEPNKFNSLQYFDCRWRSINLYWFSEYFLHNYASQTTNDWSTYTLNTKTKYTTSFRNRRSMESKIETDWVCTDRSRRTLHADLNRGAFHYDANYDYTFHSSVVIRKMDKLCMYCSALKF